MLHCTVVYWVIINYFLCSSSRVSNRFHLAQCTFSHELEQKQTVYISQPEAHKIVRIKKVSGVSDAELESNSEPFIGNGERCLPGDSDECGDGGKAINARLTYPKGMLRLTKLNRFEFSFCEKSDFLVEQNFWKYILRKELFKHAKTKKNSDECGDGGKAINARLTYPKGTLRFH